MSVWFVSRHQGAIDWIKEQQIQIDCWTTHIDCKDVEPGDTVIGVMSLAMAANFCEKNVKCLVLTYDVPQALRGQELDAKTLADFGCKLVRYQVTRVPME